MSFFICINKKAHVESPHKQTYTHTNTLVRKLCSWSKIYKIPTIYEYLVGAQLQCEGSKGNEWKRIVKYIRFAFQCTQGENHYGKPYLNAGSQMD